MLKMEQAFLLRRMQLGPLSLKVKGGPKLDDSADAAGYSEVETLSASPLLGSPKKRKMLSAHAAFALHASGSGMQW